MDINHEGFDPRLQINIATNGGTRNKTFWKNLGELSLSISHCILDKMVVIQNACILFGVSMV